MSSQLQLVSQRRRMWNTFVRNRAAVVGLALAVVIVVLSAGAPLIARQDPYRQMPGNRLSAPTAQNVLGTDNFGRDIFARLVYAGRVSLIVGLCSVLLGGVVGTTLGLVAGYSGGKIENLIMRVVDVMMAFPSLLLGITVLAVLGSGLEKMIVAIGLMLSAPFARVVHGSTLAIREQEFVQAAQAIGVGRVRILLRHIFPNILGEIVVLASLWMASAIRIEANLSFIGLGVSPPTPTWGNMIREGALNLTNAPWVSFFPGLAILVTVLAFNLFGDGLRDIFDPRLQV